MTNLFVKKLELKGSKGLQLLICKDYLTKMTQTKDLETNKLLCPSEQWLYDGINITFEN